MKDTVLLEKEKKKKRREKEKNKTFFKIGVFSVRKQFCSNP